MVSKVIKQIYARFYSFSVQVLGCQVSFYFENVPFYICLC